MTGFHKVLQKASFIHVLFLHVWVMSFTFGCRESANGSDDDANSELILSNLTEVDTVLLKVGVFRKEIVSNGKLSASKKGDLKFKVGGQLVQLYAKNGDLVKAGQVIAVLDQFQYLQKLEEAKVGVKRASIDLEDQLLGYGVRSTSKDSIPDIVYEGAAIRSGYLTSVRNLDIAKMELESTVLKAPYSGKIANVSQQVFEQVATMNTFCTLIDDSAFEVQFHIIESEIADVVVNDKVVVLPFSGTQLYHGFVSEINPLVDPNGLVLVKARIKNNGRLWHGMNVKVVIEKATLERFVVPKAAVLFRNNKQVLFKYVNGLAHWVYVQTKFENSTSYSIRADVNEVSELVPGDTIITSGNLNLIHKSPVKVRSNANKNF